MSTNAMARLIYFCLQNRGAGWRKAIVSERRTAVDWATEIRRLLEDDYADSDKIILVCDQLNIHKLSSLYEAFEPTIARRARRTTRNPPYP